MQIRHLERYLPGNRLTIYTDGRKVFSDMLSAIAAAKESIHLESYIFSSDRVGCEFGDALERKAKEGTSVRLIYDAVGSLGLDGSLLTRLRNAGVQTLEYHPVAPWRAHWAWSRRDHRKILTVDGKTAFTGGVNISEVHAPQNAAHSGWRDLHVRVEGPSVRELERLFRAVWREETGRDFPIEKHREENPGSSAVWVAANREFLHRYRIRSSYIKALHMARKEVLIAHAYFIPDRRLRAALAGASKRGVEVKILVPGRTDVAAAWRAARSRYDQLLRHGVRLFEWPGPVLHEKAAVVDRAWSAVGSYNMDHRSLLHNLEVNLHVLDSEFSSRIAEILLRDISVSPEIRLEHWRRRPFAEKALELFFYQFRHLL